MKKRSEKQVDIQEDIENKLEIAESEIINMPLDTYEHYMAYNEAARKLNRKLRICKYPIKPCPEALHAKQRVTISRTDKTSNPIPVYLSNDQIHFEKKLEVGKTYELPICVVEYLAKKGVSQWGIIEKKDGSKDTAVIGMEPRFNLRSAF